MMRSNWRGVASALAALTPLGALAIGEGAARYDEDHKVHYAKHQVWEWHHRTASDLGTDDNKQRESGSAETSTAWLGSAPPKFPYLLSISPGDDPAVVSNALLSGSRVLGSYKEETRATLERLTAPTSQMESVIHKIAKRYSELKAGLYADVPADCDPHAKQLATADDIMMNAFIAALKELRHSLDKQGGAQDDGEAKDAEDAAGNEDPTSTSDTITQATPPAPETVPVFFFRGFDALNDHEAEKWLQWTFQLTNEGLAHVVLLTTSAITPSKMQWLETRHLRGLSATSPDGVADFVAVLLRAANGTVDGSSAEEKLRKLSIQYDLNLFRIAKEDSEERPDELSDRDGKPSHDQHAYGLGSAAEADIIVQTAGNWWSDMDIICQRLVDSDLGNVTNPEERQAIIREVCESYLQESEVELLAALHMDGSVVLGDTPAVSDSEDVEQTSTPSSDANQKSDSMALSALEAWKCLETLAGVAPVNGGSGVVGSAQQLLKKKNERPVNCANPVEALLPFNARAEGEQKFLDLIDQRVLLLRPKVPVEIGVIPCKMSALVSPCWVQVRPVIKKAFERIWRNDAYFNVVLDLEHFAANNQMREEVNLYEQEVNDRRRALVELKRDFAMIQYSLSPAEKAQRKAELALIDVEVQAKEVYLEKLRSLLSP